MHTNESLILRQLLTKINPKMEAAVTKMVENSHSRTIAQANDLAKKQEGMEEMVSIVRGLIEKIILTSENEAETEWQEGLQREAFRHKMYQGRELLKELTNKRDKTVLRLNEDELEMELAKFNYFWQLNEKNWVKVG